jgi:hypothetical protein
MSDPCCNIVYNSEVVINEFHANNFIFVLDSLPVSFLASKFNTKCLQSLGPNPADYAMFNNIEAYKEANNDLKTLALYLKSINIPGINVGTTNIGMNSVTDFRTVNGKMVFDELTTTLQVDENFFIPRFFWYWLTAAANPEEIMKYNQYDYTKNFYPDGHLILLDNNRDKTIELKFNKIHPKSVSSIRLDYSEPKKAFIDVSWIYTGFVLADEYKVLYTRV